MHRGGDNADLQRRHDPSDTKLKVTKAFVGLRVDEDEEREGLDLVLHGEQIF
jgi:hypothetical protein